MGFGKFLGCIVGGAAAIIAAPVILPAVAAAGAAVASTAVGGAVIGAATAAGATVAEAAAATAIGEAVVGAATVVGGAAASIGGVVAETAAATAIGEAVVGAATATAAVVTEVAGAATASSVIASGIVGAGLTYSGMTSAEGFANMNEAEEKCDSAKENYNNATMDLENEQQLASDKLVNLNKLKCNIYTNEIKETIEIIKRIKNIKESELSASNVYFIFNPEEIKEIELTSIEADKILRNSVDGIGMSSAISSAATGLVSNFGIASTGTAISSLSGAAAHNATLATLGGGALKVGGAGMAGGQVMLGGLALLPTAIILSHNYAKNAEEQLTEATQYYNKVKIEIEKVNAYKIWIKNEMYPRINEIETTLKKITNYYNGEWLIKLKNIGDKTTGTINFKECSEEEKKCIVESATIISDLKQLIKAPLFDGDGMIKETTVNLIELLRENKKYFD